MPLASVCGCLQHLVHRVDGRGRHAGRAQALEQVGGLERAGSRGQRLDELAATGHARGIVREARIARELGDAERLGEP